METLTKIAAETLGLETLKERKMDSLDFHELSVWGIKKALEQAFKAGAQAAATALQESGSDVTVAEVLNEMVGCEDNESLTDDQAAAGTAFFERLCDHSQALKIATESN